MPIVGELEPAGMAQHVRVDREGHLCGLAEPSHHAAEPDRTHWCPALAHEHVPPWLLLPLQSAERPKLASGQRMHRVYAVLGAGDVQSAMNPAADWIGQVDRYRLQ